MIKLVPTSTLWRRDGRWHQTPSIKTVFGMASAEPAKWSDEQAADPIVGAEYFTGAPARHFYNAGHVHQIAPAIEAELREAGFGALLKEFDDPIPVVVREVMRPMRTAGEARLEQELGDLKAHNARAEQEWRARLEALEAKPAKKASA